MAASTNDKLSMSANGGIPAAATVNVARATGVTTISLDTGQFWPTATGIKFSTYKTNTAGTKVAGSQIDWKGTLTGTNLNNIVRTGGAADTGNAVGDRCVMMITSQWGEDFTEAFLQEHTNPNGAHDATKVAMLAGAQTFTGTKTFSTAPVLPDGYARVIRQNDTTNVTEQTARILTGWGVMTPGVVNTATETVTFGTAFTSAPIVTISFGGDSAAGTTYGSGGSNIKDSVVMSAHTVSATGFSAKFVVRDGTNYAAGNTVFYQWMAIGI